ncbi:hypothetical protein niasHS_006907 [Heterodera schachtii]|uniref:RRM domain-containing protein n=1 Tax=Heterodera schachtii TaxID=97005 RepID=A0ABD2JFX7_HETSC
MDRRKPWRIGEVQRNDDVTPQFSTKIIAARISRVSASSNLHLHLFFLMSEDGGEKNGEEANRRKDNERGANENEETEGEEKEEEGDEQDVKLTVQQRLQRQPNSVPKKQSAKECLDDKTNNKQKTPSAERKLGGGSSSSAPLTEATDAESQATTTNVDESGESDAGGQQNEPGKMFIGGLSWQTSAEGLRDYFCKFGEVNECMVMRDPTTKRARGFGFITFADPTAVEKVLANDCHELDGKRIDPKVAFPKKQQPKMVVKTKKVFIGGLSSNSTLDDIKAYFAQYGKIEDAMLMFDKATQRHRGFGFITFDDDEVSDKVCEIHFHEINGKMVECKKAQPKEVMLPVQLNKTRAAAARNLYGLAPEQLLAYASYMPRMPPFYGPTVSSHGHHHGLLTAYPTVNPGMFGNGFPHPPHQPGTITGTNAFGMATSGRSSSNNNGTTGLNARDFAAAQLVAQQQAVYEAAMVYANQLSSLAGGGAGGEFGGGPSTASPFGGRGGHHQHMPQPHQQTAFVTSAPQQSHAHHHHFASLPPSVLAAPPVHFHHHQQQHLPPPPPGGTPSGGVVPLNFGKSS